MPSIGYIVIILFVIFICFLLIVFGESNFFEVYPPQLIDGTTIEQWKADFQRWACVCAGASGTMSLLWFILAQWCFKINKWKDAEGKRWIWVLFGVLCLVLPIIFMVGGVGVEEIESSPIWVYIFFVMNGLLPYYFITLLFSPASFKYIPIGAKRFRSPCPW